METRLIGLIILLTCLLIFFLFFQNNEYKTIDDVEKLFQKHDISYTSKGVEDEYILDIAKEQRLYEVENNNIYIYIVDESDIENADYRVSNEILDGNYTVSTTKNMVFAYTENNLEKFQQKLYEVIEEIKKSES